MSEGHYVSIAVAALIGSDIWLLVSLCRLKNAISQLPETADAWSDRDEFALAAMQATVSRIPLMSIVGYDELLPGLAALPEGHAEEIRKSVAVLAYQYADVMMEARKP